MLNKYPLGGFKSLGKKFKRAFGKIAKAFGKLGPLGSIALSFLLPGMGSVLSGWLSNMGPVGEFILNIGSKIQQGANWVKNGVGRVFNRVTDAIEYGMNAVSKPFMKEGARGMGSAFRDFVSEIFRFFFLSCNDIKIYCKKYRIKFFMMHTPRI